jgi:hypothetical protein
MNALLLKSGDKKSLKLLLELAKKMHIEINELSATETDDIEFAQKIEKGMKTKTVSRKSVMNALGL